MIDRICASNNSGNMIKLATGIDVNNFWLQPVDGWTRWVACAYSGAGENPNLITYKRQTFNGSGNFDDVETDRTTGWN